MVEMPSDIFFGSLDSEMPLSIICEDLEREEILKRKGAV